MDTITTTKICIIYLFFPRNDPWGNAIYIIFFSNNPFKHDYANHSTSIDIFMYNQEILNSLLLYSYNIDCI